MPEINMLLDAGRPDRAGFLQLVREGLHNSQPVVLGANVKR
jgi:hypothetical protein